MNGSAAGVVGHPAHLDDYRRQVALRSLGHDHAGHPRAHHALESCAPPRAITWPRACRRAMRAVTPDPVGLRSTCESAKTQMLTDVPESSTPSVRMEPYRSARSAHGPDASGPEVTPDGRGQAIGCCDQFPYLRGTHVETEIRCFAPPRRTRRRIRCRSGS